jgi:hypothetical protein
MPRRTELSPASHELLLARAGTHLDELGNVLAQFRQSGAYDVIASVDPATALQGDDALHIGYPPGGPAGAPLVMWAGDTLTRAGYIPVGDPLPVPGRSDSREIVLTGHSRSEPPSAIAGVLIADAIHNMRATLDHVIWQMSSAYQIPPLLMPRTGPGSEWRTVAWPTALDEAAWERARTSKLRFLPDGITDKIRGFQPFVRHPEAPASDPFALLEDLWNIYKHRHLPLVESWVGLDKVLSTTIGHHPSGDDEHAAAQFRHLFMVINERPPGPFEDGAELARVREAPDGRGILHVWHPERGVSAEVTVQISFGADSPAAGAPVEPTLRQLLAEVDQAIRSLEPYL